MGLFFYAINHVSRDTFDELDFQATVLNKAATVFLDLMLLDILEGAALLAASHAGAAAVSAGADAS